MEPPAYAVTVARMAADLTTILAQGDVVHVVHGGFADDDTVWNYACHLQATWRAGLVWVSRREHLARLVQVVQGEDRRGISPLVAVVPYAFFASAPGMYDALRHASPAVTLIVSVPLSSVAEDALPYGRMPGMSVVFCSSAHVERARAIARVAHVYACPQSPDDCARFCAVLGHDEGVAWRLDVEQVEPAFVTVCARATRHATQDAVDRLFWWSSAACLSAFTQLADTGDVQLLTGADMLDAVLVLPAHCPLVVTRACVKTWSRHLDATHFPIGLHAPAVRTSVDAARVASSVGEWDCHLLAPVSCCVVPISVQFKTAAYMKPGVIQCIAHTRRRALETAPPPMPKHWRSDARIAASDHVPIFHLGSTPMSPVHIPKNTTSFM